MLRRTSFSLDEFCSCWVAFCMRRPNCSFSSASSSVCRSAVDLSASAFFASVRFIGFAPSAHQALDEDGLDRQLRRGERERFLGERLVHAVHLVEHLAGLDLAYVVLGIALAVAHADLGGLLRHRLVREDADPDAAAALDVTRHGATGGLDLAC